MDRQELSEKEVPKRLLLKSEEAASTLAISPRKLWELTDSGEIPCIRIGRAVRYSFDHLREWIKSQQTDENAP